MEKIIFKIVVRLLNVNIPKNMNIMEEKCFDKCCSLKNINLSKITKFKGQSSFSICRKLENIGQLNNGVIELPDKTFTSCSNLKINSLNNIIKLGTECFKSCRLLDENIVTDVEEIGDNCFFGCNFKEVYLKKAKKVGYNAFGGIENLKKIRFGNPNIPFLGKNIAEGSSVNEWVYPLSYKTQPDYLEFLSKLRIAKVIWYRNYENPKGEVTQDVRLNSLKSPSITREGYEIEGWYKEPECINKVKMIADLGEIIDSDLVIKDPVLYANWTAKKPTTSGETNKPSDTKDPTTSGETNKPSDTKDPTTSGETNKPSDTKDPTTSGEINKPSDTKDPTTLEETNKPSDTKDPTAPGGANEPSDTKDPTESGETNKPSDTKDPTTSGETNKPSDTKDPTTSGETNKPSDTKDPTTSGEINKPSDTKDPTTLEETNKPSDTKDPTAPGEANEPSDTKDPTESGETNEPSDTKDLTALGEIDSNKTTNPEETKKPNYLKEPAISEEINNSSDFNSTENLNNSNISNDQKENDDDSIEYENNNFSSMLYKPRKTKNDANGFTIKIEDENKNVDIQETKKLSLENEIIKNVFALTGEKSDIEIKDFNWSYRDNVNSNIEIVKSGALSKIIKNEQCIGIYLKSNDYFKNNTIIEMNIKNIIKPSKLYSYSEELGKFILIDENLQINDEIIKFRPNNKKEYLIAQFDLNEDNVAIQGWNKVLPQQSNALLSKHINELSWVYLKGQELSKGWIKDFKENNWYFMNEKGIMETGWLKDKYDKWYYLNTISDGSKGAMKIGWNKINNKWYYLKNDGVLAVNTIIDGYAVGYDGKLI